MEITLGDSYLVEKEYVVKVVLGEFLGIDYVIRRADGAQTVLTVRGNGSKRLVLSDGLFAASASDWLTEPSLPKRPLKRWRVEEDLPDATLSSRDIPVLYGETLENGGYLTRSDSQVRVGADLLGGIFFLLTRYEELVATGRDLHGRFPASQSLAVQEEFLTRPLVDEYVEILWTLLRELSQNLQRTPSQYRLFLSHDVDWPFTVIDRPWGVVARQIAAALIRRNDWAGAAAVFRYRWLNSPELDPANCFDWIMRVSEEAGIRSEFYFISGHSGPGVIDGVYQLEDQKIRRLLKAIHEREHIIGLHPSYETWKDPLRIKAEFKRLLDICRCMGIEQNVWGGRQHYLRWAAPATWKYWEEAELNYDSSVGFADMIGFRCGTGREFPVFDLIGKEELHLRERPLVIMDQSLLNRQYMNLTGEQVINAVKALVQTCRFYRTPCSILWHNTLLVTEPQRALYRRCLALAA